MLVVTDGAATAIRDITSQQEVPTGAGLRIAADDTEGSLMLSLVPEPYDGDKIVDMLGARVFLDSQAAELLDDKELGVAVDAGGAVQFAVSDRTGWDSGADDEPWT